MPNNNTTSTSIFVGRQPILDRDGTLYAYELLFRSGQMEHAEFSSDVSATARVITTVFNELGLENSLGNAFGFINVSEEMLMSEAIELLPPDKIVIELLETIPPTPTVIERARDLVAKGFDRATVKRVEHLLYISEYKRFQSAPGTRLTPRAFWLDRRYPIANRFRDPS